MGHYVFLVSGVSSWVDLSLMPQEDLKAHILPSGHILGPLYIKSGDPVGD